MKKLFRFFTVVSAFLFFNSFQADSQTIIKYDFSTKKFTSDIKNIKEGEAVQIKIININTLLYNVEIKVDTHVYHTQAPLLFLQHFPDVNVMLEGPSINLLGDASGPKNGQGEKLSKDHLGKMDSLISKYRAYLSKIQKRLIDISYETTLLNSPTVGEKIKEYVKQQGELKKKIRELYSELHESGELDAEYIIWEALYKEKLSEEFLRLKGLKILTDNLRKEVKLEKLIGQWLVLRKDSFCFTSPPIEADGDEMAITITITPKKKAGDLRELPVTTTLKKEEVHATLAVIKKFGISFSTGLMYTNLIDEEYKAKPNFEAGTISNYSIVKENSGRFSIGAVALMHYSYKFTKNLGIGFNLGVGVPVATTSPNYLIGSSFLLGNKNRIVLNVSYALGRVKRISTTTELSRIYTTVPTIDMIDKWEGNYAFSLTYNIFNSK